LNLGHVDFWAWFEGYGGQCFEVVYEF
jgi:hypothetical protein